MSDKLKNDIWSINHAIPDDNLRHIIFTNDDLDDDFLCSANEIYRYFNNIMEVAFFFVFARFKQWQNSPRHELYKPEKGTCNFNRIVSLFEQLYNVNDLKPDNISDALIDIQIDITKSSMSAKENDNEIHQALNDFFLKYDIAKSASYNECDYLARQFITTDYVNDPLKKDGVNVLHLRRDTLIDLVTNTFPFLSKTTAEIVPIKGLKQVKKVGLNVSYEECDKYNEIIFTYHNTGRSELRQQYELPDEIPLNMSLIASRKSYYYLERIDKFTPAKSHAREIPVLNYIKFANSPDSVEIYILRSDDRIEYLPDGAYFIQDDNMAAFINKSYFIFEKKASSSKTVIKDFATINYRYIKKLSLALCDVISNDTKRDLFCKYGKDHPELFNDADKNGQLSDEEINAVDWDSSIAVLLVDEGAMMVLRTILLKSNAANIFFEQLCQNLEARIGPKKFSSTKVLKGAESSYLEIKEKRNKFSRMDMIPNDIRQDFDKGESYIRAEVSASYLIDELSRISGGNYGSGSFTFPVSIISRLKMLDKIESSNLPISSKLEGLKALANQTMVQLVAFYEGFFAFAYATKSFRYDHSQSKPALLKLQQTANQRFIEAFHETYERLTKEENFNSEYIIKEIHRLNLETSKPNANNPVLNNKYTYTKYFLGKKSFVDYSVFNSLVALSSVGEKEYRDALDLVRQMFNYLKTGTTDDEWHEDETAIYPYIATHIFNHESRDGFVIKHFDVLVEDETDADIKVLSDFEYSINHRYYCLPSALRYNRNIDVWIEPILIDYNVFEIEKWN